MEKRADQILAEIVKAGGMTREQIAKHFNLKLATVNMHLMTLRHDKLVVTDRATGIVAPVIDGKPVISEQAKASVDLVHRGRRADPDSKASKARKIFQEMLPGHQRKEILAVFINDLHMTQAGAATYFQNFRKEFGQVHQQTAPVETATATH